MRAAWYERQGAPEDVLQVGSLDVPEPAAGEVRVRIHASGVNRSDTYGRSGRQAPMAFARIIPHQDGSGVVDAVGQGVPTDRVGQRVWVYEATWNRPGGSAAEYTVVPARRAIRLPDGIDFDAGACLGIPAMTAHRAVFADESVTGQTVLVTGGAGAVGSAAIQLACWGGARVLATVSSGAKAQVARDAGADETINYRTEDVVDAIKRLTDSAGVDRIVDVDFGGNLSTTIQALKPDGVVASYATRGDPEPKIPFRSLMVKNLTVRAILVYTMSEAAKTAASQDITRTLESGALRPVIGQRLRLDDIAQAHTDVERGSVVGNTVLQLA